MNPPVPCRSPRCLPPWRRRETLFGFSAAKNSLTALVGQVEFGCVRVTILSSPGVPELADVAETLPMPRCPVTYIFDFFHHFMTLSTKYTQNEKHLSPALPDKTAPICGVPHTKGCCDVHGTIRRSSTDFERNSPSLRQSRFHLHYADMADSMSLIEVIMDVARRDLQLRGAEPRAGIVRCARIQQPTPIPREFCACRGSAPDRTRRQMPHLSGIHFRTIRQGGGSSARTKTPFHPYSPYAVAKLLRLPDREGIPRGIQHVLLLRHPL